MNEDKISPNQLFKIHTFWKWSTMVLVVVAVVLAVLVVFLLINGSSVVSGQSSDNSGGGSAEETVSEELGINAKVLSSIPGLNFNMAELGLENISAIRISDNGAYVAVYGWNDYSAPTFAWFDVVERTWSMDTRGDMKACKEMPRAELEAFAGFQYDEDGSFENFCTIVSDDGEESNLSAAAAVEREYYLSE